MSSTATPIAARLPGETVHLPKQHRVLIVDDSLVARAVLARAVAANPRFAVAGAVADARAALAFLHANVVDAILLDIEMPDLDGLAALPDMLIAGGGAKVLVVSSSCEEGGSATVQALALGAADTLVKPAAGDFSGGFAADLIDKLGRLLGSPDAATPEPPKPPPPARKAQFGIVAIGASTGGIHALSQLLREIPASCLLPIIVTQHLPTSFMPYFAAQVAVLAGRPCEVAVDRMRVRPGRVIIAPGDAHLRVVSLGEGVGIRLTTESAPSGCMPSVDPMFDSVADVFGARALAVVLSGMGRDGSEGARRITAAGGAVVVQDQASSVVWGMPGAIAAAGGASAVLAPFAIGQLIASGRRPG